MADKCKNFDRFRPWNFSTKEHNKEEKSSRRFTSEIDRQLQEEYERRCEEDD